MKSILLLAASFTLFSSCASAAPATVHVQSAQNDSFRANVEGYDTDRDALRSFYNMDGSSVQNERFDSFDANWLEALRTTNFDELGVEDRIDHLLLRSEIEYEGQQRAIQRVRRTAAHELMPFAEAIHELERRRWLIAELDPLRSAETLAQIAEQVQQVKKRVKALDTDSEAADSDAVDSKADTSKADLPLSAVEAQRLARWISDLRRTLSTWYEHYAAFDPGFAWWNEKPYESAKKSLEELAKHLREEIASQKGGDDDPLVGDPIGRDALLIDLAHEWLAYTPEELIAIGERELAWCDKQLEIAASEMGHAGDWPAALEEVKRAHVGPGEQDELVAAQAREAIAFLKERDLVTIPALCEETWRVQMLSKEGQRTLPFAAYGGQKMLVAFPTQDMDHESKLMSLRGNNKHFTRCVTPHELIPGHHLQGFMAQRYATHRGLFRTPFLVEGWALYWEMLEWDEGWAKSPEDRVGMLFWRKHRAARIIVSLGFHLGQMTPDEMIEFLVERVGHERDNATSEVRRYIGGGYSPLYQCGYMIGGLQLRALARELVGAGRMSLKQFHDAVLREGPIPIEMIRAALSGTQLSVDAGPSWRGL